MAAFLARVPDLDDGFDQLFDLAQRDRAAAEEHQHDLSAGDGQLPQVVDLARAARSRCGRRSLRQDRSPSSPSISGERPMQAMVRSALAAMDGPVVGLRLPISAARAIFHAHPFRAPAGDALQQGDQGFAEAVVVAQQHSLRRHSAR